MPMDPDSLKNKATIVTAFVNQAAPDIRCKLQQVERKNEKRKNEKRLQDLIAVAEGK